MISMILYTFCVYFMCRRDKLMKVKLCSRYIALLKVCFRLSMAPRKEPPLSTVFSDLEKSYSLNCASVLDAAAAQIGEARLPLVAGITSKNDLWTILHKYKTVKYSYTVRSSKQSG